MIGREHATDQAQHASGASSPGRILSILAPVEKTCFFDRPQSDQKWLNIFQNAPKGRPMVSPGPASRPLPGQGSPGRRQLSKKSVKSMTTKSERVVWHAIGHKARRIYILFILYICMHTYIYIYIYIYKLLCVRRIGFVQSIFKPIQSLTGEQNTNCGLVSTRCEGERRRGREMGETEGRRGDTQSV